jgi:lambda family phage minor tail protein L
VTIHASLSSEIQSLEPSAVIELFVLDLSGLGGDVVRFHAGTNELSQNVVWQGESYVRFPVQASGFEFTGQGQIPRPRFRVANVFSAITALILQFDDLRGAKVIRRRTLAKHLDKENFPENVNPSEDPTAEFPPDIYFVDRKSSEDRDTVEFELAASVDLAGVNLPRRQIIQNVCVWKYRGSECGFAGPPLFDAQDNLLELAPTPEGQAVMNAWRGLTDAKSARSQAIKDHSAATYAQGAACEPVPLSSAFDLQIYASFGFYPYGNFGVAVYLDPYTGTPMEVGYYNGQSVTVGGTYRRGAFVRTWAEYPGYKFDLYRVEVFGPSQACIDSTAVTAAKAAVRASAEAAVISAQAAFDSAVSALPSSDPTFAQDQCGKRLGSCKLRFGATAELPFGSFPAAGLIR